MFPSIYSRARLWVDDVITYILQYQLHQRFITNFISLDILKNIFQYLKTCLIPRIQGYQHVPASAQYYDTDVEALGGLSELRGRARPVSTPTVASSDPSSFTMAVCSIRLIDTETLKFRECIGTQKPREYAILSHTWGTEEVTFKEWAGHNTDPAIKRKAGFRKIEAACRLAQKNNLKYLWCDTNCINKADQVELQSAINSMFYFYQYV